jgi:hypothetical protein
MEAAVPGCFTGGVTEHTQAAPDEAQALQRLSHRLHQRLREHRAATIDQAIAEAVAEFDGHPIRDFVPILVEREVLDRLRTDWPDFRSPQTPGSTPARWEQVTT